MAVRSTVYCIFIIITTLYSFGDTKRNIWIRMYYNGVFSTGCIKEEKEVCYFKDGDLLNANCLRETFIENNRLRLYQCKNGIDFGKNLDQCKATSRLNETGLRTVIVLSKEDDKSTVFCKFSEGSYKSNKSPPTKLVLQPDEPPTIIINNLNFNKSLSKPNIYEGKIGEYLKIACKSNEKSGTLQWDYCKDLTKEPFCLTLQNNGTQIMYNVELTQKLDGTELKCVYNNVNQKNTTTSVIFYLQLDSKENATGNYNEDGENDKDKWFVPAIASISSIVIIIGTISVGYLIVYCRKKRSTSPNQPPVGQRNVDAQVYYTICDNHQPPENQRNTPERVNNTEFEDHIYCYIDPVELRTFNFTNPIYN